MRAVAGTRPHGASVWPSAEQRISLVSIDTGGRAEDTELDTDQESVAHAAATEPFEIYS